ncbi:MAG: class I SAM-dependent methyltransferase [Paludibacter sp.]
MKCPACNHETVVFTTAVNYYSKKLNTCNLMYCKNCVCFFKDNFENNLEVDFKNLGVKSYNNPENFSAGYSKRSNFLKYLHDYAVKNINQNFKINSWLDYGCGMGYLLFHLKDIYKEVIGVEIAEDGREMCKSNNIQAFQTISDIPIDKKFDVISSIDSFYYSLEPVALIDSFKNVLNNGGYVVVRVSLRTWLIRLNKLFNRVPDDSLRDHFINYSYNSIVKLFSDNGFVKVKHTFKESGKSYYKPSILIINYFIRLVYFISFGFLNFHTGVTIVFRRK